MKKILLAVGDCVHSAEAVKYAARISSANVDVSYTLFHVQPPVPPIFREAADTDTAVRAEVTSLVQQNSEAAACITRELKETMVREGIPEKRVEMVTQPMRLGMAKDIIDMAEQGRFDAIVLGRRALTPARDFFIGMTAAKVVDHALSIPVWVASGAATSKKILIAVDGTENSLRVVGHVVDLVGAHPQLRITLFHVLPHLRHYYSVDFERKNPHLQQILKRQDKARMEGFYEKAYQRLEKGGLKENQINVVTNTRSFDIGTAIFSEMRTGQHGTVVIGRRGERDAFFSGGMAIYLVQKVTKQVLWVVP
jgi:nucleotide-binding universal stress UspA family protein